MKWWVAVAYSPHWVTGPSPPGFSLRQRLRVSSAPSLVPRACGQPPPLPVHAKSSSLGCPLCTFPVPTPSVPPRPQPREHGGSKGAVREGAPRSRSPHAGAVPLRLARAAPWALQRSLLFPDGEVPQYTAGPQIPSFHSASSFHGALGTALLSCLSEPVGKSVLSYSRILLRHVAKLSTLSGEDLV